MYAEQLMLYVLGVASPTFPVNKQMYFDMQKPKEDYEEIKDIIYTYCGTLFTYQFSHAWLDFRGRKDFDGIDWFENSIKATFANRKYCIKNKDKFKTFGENSWGLTPCVGPNGYSGGYGAKPSIANIEEQNDGTITPCGPAGSIVFTPELSIKALEYFYNHFPKLWGKYGFKDAYNLENGKWYAKEVIGIDKGITMIMNENNLKEAKKLTQETFVLLKNEDDILPLKENQSDYEGYETIQMYIQDLFGSVVRPVKELKGFKKEFFKPHEIKRIEFEINSEKLKFWNEKLEFGLEEGDFKVYVGGDSANVLEEKFQLI